MATDKWLGFQEMDLRQYLALKPLTPPEQLLLTADRVLETEEKQRLRDLTFQFDLLPGDP